MALAYRGKRIWTRQPQQPERIAPEWAALGFDRLIFNAAARPALGTQFAIQAVGSGKIAPNAGGLAVSPAGSSSDGWQTTANADFLNGLTALTVAAEFTPTAMTGVIAARWGTSPNYGGFNLTFADGKAALVIAENSSTSTWCGKKSTALAAGKLHRAVFVWRGNATMEVYLDGAACPDDTWFGGTPLSLQSGVSFPMYFCRHGDSGSGETGAGVQVNQVAFSLRAIPASAARKLSENLSQLYAPRSIWVPVSSGGAASPVAANATYYQMIAQQRIGY